MHQPLSAAIRMDYAAGYALRRSVTEPGGRWPVRFGTLRVEPSAPRAPHP